jgi:hypothetical protein
VNRGRRCGVNNDDKSLTLRSKRVLLTQDPFHAAIGLQSREIAIELGLSLGKIIELRLSLRA